MEEVTQTPAYLIKLYGFLAGLLLTGLSFFIIGELLDYGDDRAFFLPLIIGSGTSLILMIYPERRVFGRWMLLSSVLAPLLILVGVYILLLSGRGIC